MKRIFHTEDCGLSLLCRCAWEGSLSAKRESTARPGTPDGVANREPSPTAVAMAGLTAIAIAMGVGRFALTPILPLMQQDAGLTISQGAWLASANYAGFLLGALSAAGRRAKPATAIRRGLLAIGALSLAMGIEQRFETWVGLRAAAGFANGRVQVLTFAWCLEKLAALKRPFWSGAAFAGIGVGIAITGALCLALTASGAGSRQTWIILGLISLAATRGIWRTLIESDESQAGDSRPATWPSQIWNSESLLLILCFGVSGFGYIVPATFFPVMARRMVANSMLFGFAWPIFGAAAAIAPALSGALARSIGNRRLWAMSHLVMAFAVVLPARWSGFGAVMIAALLVGATFVVNAMAAMRAAHALAGPRATALMAAMTAVFGCGQIIGSLSVSCLVDPDGDFSKPLLLASVALIGSVYVLSR